MENNQTIQTTKTQSQSAWDESKLKLLKNTICKGATDDELQLFLHACERTGLDPFMKQIHAIFRNVKNKETGKWEKFMTIQTAIDGFRLIAERTGNYSPGKEPTYLYGDNNLLVASTSYVMKRTNDGTWHEVAATAFFQEYAQKKSSGELTTFWQNMPHNQLAKCAEALALRKAFPADLSGLYTMDEMQQADVEISVQPEPIAEEKSLPPPSIPKPILCISIPQAEELKILLKNSEPGYSERLLKHFKIQNWEQLDEKDFNKTRSYIEKNVSRYQTILNFEKYQAEKEAAYAKT